jgi:hypothetical protein
MKDVQAQLEKLRTDAADCALIRDLATEPKKRELFTKLAAHLTVLADEVERAIAAEASEVKRGEWQTEAGGGLSKIRSRFGRKLVTLRDAGEYIAALPKAQHDAPEWQAAMEALMLVVERGGPTMLAASGSCEHSSDGSEQSPCCPYLTPGVLIRSSRNETPSSNLC